MIVAVTGPPAAGKTTLAVPLARRLAIPLFAKDPIKEALFDELGPSTDASWSRRLSDASYRILVHLITASPNAVLDLNLPREWAPDFVATRRSFIQVFCHCPQTELERRLLSRATERHAAHDDDALLDDLRSQGVRGTEPAPLPGPLLEVETSGSIDIAAVAAWVGQRLTDGRA